MAILGLLLLAAATVAGVELTISNRAGSLDFEAFGYTFAGSSTAGVFLLGALTMAVALLGLFMITGAFQRRRHVATVGKHRARIEETEGRLGEVEQTNAELARENDELRTRLADHERAMATMGGVAVPPGVGDVAYGDQVSDAVRSETITDTGRFDPYPTEGGTTSGAAVNTGTRYDGETVDVTDHTTDNDKAGVVGRFRGNR